MYIRKIKLNNFRNYYNFEIDLQDGLNVIVGSNNSGKTGLLKAINLLNNPEDICFHDFNKNDLLANYNTIYKTTPPEIMLEFSIHHQISEDDTDDESIIKLISFLGMEQIEEFKEGAANKSIYSIVATINMRYIFNPKEIDKYTSQMSGVADFQQFLSAFELCQKYYSWTFSNGKSNTTVDKKDVTDIFMIDYIEAERNAESIYSDIKKALNDYIKNEANDAGLQLLKKQIADLMKINITPVLKKIKKVIENENNDIGLSRGNVSIFQDIRPTASISDAYVIDVQDTKSDYILPLTHNGVGYNNLINIYMLIKLVELQKGKDFRILCLEEPEAHLHPAMQYKLFKFLKKIDEENNLNQQIIVTTHSSNITAVAGLDNMYMVSYDRENKPTDGVYQSMRQQFKGQDDAKNHMMKFLDVTRSDMLFADKVILVEGIAEKLLLPKFMEKCNCSFEDEHISIVEIGGKHFEHFIRVFYENSVKKKVLCITDKDISYPFKAENSDGSGHFSVYKSSIPNHVSELAVTFSDMNNLKIVYQAVGGRTFEDELFLSNVGKNDIACELLKLVTSTLLHSHIDTNKLDYQKWKNSVSKIDRRVGERIKKLINQFDKAIQEFTDDSRHLRRLFFAKLFWLNAKDRKGDLALSILVNENLMDKISVPTYIKEGLEWLSQ